MSRVVVVLAIILAHAFGTALEPCPTPRDLLHLTVVDAQSNKTLLADLPLGVVLIKGDTNDDILFEEHTSADEPCKRDSFRGKSCPGAYALFVPATPN